MRIYLLILSSVLFVAACGGGSNNGSSNNVAATPMTSTALSAPPPLPEYQQPAVPVAGRIWTPGYWAYDSEYYWVPGTWVAAPAAGLYWTPPYWSWNGNLFVFHEGWWGPQVGFYGGINYGYGYFGTGYQGGYWQGREFFYNQEVTNVDVTVVRTYYRSTVYVNNYVTRVSYNGGQGGVVARETIEERSARQARQIRVTDEQVQHREAARIEPHFRESINRGRPTIAATMHPGRFSGSGVVRARGAETRPQPRVETRTETPAQPRPRTPAPAPETPRKVESPQHHPAPAEPARPAEPTRPANPAQPKRNPRNPSMPQVQPQHRINQ